MFKLYLAGIETYISLYILIFVNGSNCTLLELKQTLDNAASLTLRRSNCTLLELKQILSIVLAIVSVFKLYLAGIETIITVFSFLLLLVQIVPCWN